jgi:type IV pilus assembly protein PilO
VALELKQLEGKPWYYGFGIGAAIAFGFWVVANFYFPDFNQMKHTLDAKRTELAGLNEKITQGRAAERRLPQLREEVRRIELDLQRLVQILPTKRNAEELIKKIDALTRQGDFFLKRFAPREYVNKDFYAEWPIDVTLDGTYHNLALFFARVARFSRIINVDDLILGGYATASSGRTLGAQFTMKTFIYIGDQELDDTKKAGAGKGAAPKGPNRAAPAEKADKGGV